MVEKSKPPAAPNPDLISVQLGVWKLTMLKEQSFQMKKHLKDLVSAIPLLKRLALQIYTLEPLLFVCFLASKFWSGVESAVMLYLSSRLLKIIEIGLTTGYPDKTAIIYAIVYRMFCVIGVAIIDWWSEKSLPYLKSRIKAHFELYLMEAQLKLDLPTSQEPQRKKQVNARDAYTAFEGLVEFCTDLLTTGSQLALIAESSRASGDPFFALVCLAKPIFCMLNRNGIWWKPHVVTSNNDAYQRMQALERLSSAQYRADVISGDIGKYILQQYQAACEDLGGLSDDYVGSQFHRRPTPIHEILMNIIGDLPMAYCAFMAIVYPSRFSVSSVAILTQSSSTLRWSLECVLANSDSFRRQLMEVRNLYDVSNVVNKLADGKTPYPNPSCEKNLGMSFELRNVTFAYPGSKSTKNALENVSLTIKSGHLVVVVGQNGSGKSSMVKLLSRMYDPIEGEVLVDGLPIQSYALSDLRQATATLTQDHNMFPLSLAENIGLGNTLHVKNDAMIMQAAELGGATACISKLEEGVKTVLEPTASCWGSNLVDEPTDPLQMELERQRKKIEISGGEKQRVVASRTFHRFSSGKITFVVVDEPSSALDPEGEAQLFENLRQARQGKTMVFVTHKFGHLVKYADSIICMKDGRVAEIGTHDELILANGEYAKLYNIQASAFVDSPAKELVAV
ncbi:P-loop containing nucleoside triphosphate hydrolase protein [Mycena floridula]|nr:P-loop containing nucleoside triphosphate hydrolase protein [Mycena floridula]